MAYMGILSGEATLPISFFFSLLKERQPLKERICSPRSKFFPLRVVPFQHPEKQTGVTKVFPTATLAEDVTNPHTLNRKEFEITE